MNAHEVYKTAIHRIDAAHTPGECRRLIGSLDMIDHEGDIDASERRACGILEG